MPNKHQETKKQFEYYDITCALTHDLRVCEHCKQCGEYPDVRIEMADYVERLEKALDKACEEIEEDGCCGYWNKTKKCNMPFSCKSCWKEYLLKESEEK